jgi:hypothetical protein
MQIVRTIPAPRPVAPVIRIAAPRAPSTHKKHRRHHNVGGAASGSGKALMGSAIGGAIFGFLEKQFPTMPSVPFVGRAGTVAIAAYFLSRKGGIRSQLIKDVGMAAAAIAGYELGKTGKVSGDELSGDDLQGIAAQT